MAEVSLSVAYRKKGANSEYYGGPMHYIREGLGGGLGKFLGGFYAVALFVLVVTDACFVQTNTLATSAQETFGLPLLVSGIVLVAISIFIIVLGGVICTLTALSIITSGVWSSGSTGAVLTLEAFRTVWGKWGTYILCIAIILFTYSSDLGFFVEYRTSTEYLFGEKAIKYLQWFFFVPPIIAVTMPIELSLIHI